MGLDTDHWRWKGNRSVWLRRSGCSKSLLALVMIAAVSEADQTRTIELVDGTIIQGEILSVERGIYRIGTNRLGTLTLKDSDIAAIRTVTPPLGGTDSGVSHSAIMPDAATLQKQIASHPQWIQSITALKDDPDIQTILTDPVLMKAINEGNIKVLQSDPRIQRLMIHPIVKDLQQKFRP